MTDFSTKKRFGLLKLVLFFLRNLWFLIALVGEKHQQGRIVLMLAFSAISYVLIKDAPASPILKKWGDVQKWQNLIQQTRF